MPNACYIFDMDGTLTPSAQPIDASFQANLSAFMSDRRVFFVSGSGYDQMESQLGPELCRQAEAVFPCQAGQAYMEGRLAFSHQTDWPPDLFEVLEGIIRASDWPRKTGAHIQDRGALVNCSVPGRKCSSEDRGLYVEWDSERGERQQIAARINGLFPGLDCTIAGQISVDITRRGDGKHNLLNFIEGSEPVSFFGDKCEPGGNDYSIAQAVSQRPLGVVYQVENWQDTARILKDA